MSDNPINIESDSEGDISSSSKRIMEPELHSLSSVNGDFKLETISLTDDSEIEIVFGDSLS